MKQTHSGLPYVKLQTIESIIDEVFNKNQSFGLNEFISNLEEDNAEMCIVLYSFIDALADLVLKSLEGPEINLDEAAKLPTKIKLYPQEKWQWGWNNSSEV